MQRKLIKVGTSAAVLVPKALMDEQGFKIGDMVEVELHKNDARAAKRQAVVDPRVIQWTDHFIEKHRSLLKKLSKA
jgi:antitoxin component of MazEF toxin-antitoxin module